MKSGKGYLYGTMVLGLGTIVVKVIGAIFKIPLTNLLGGVGMSYFNVAYDLYYPLCALFISGVPAALSKLISENMARGRIQDAKKLLHIALFTFTGIGLAGTAFMIWGAERFACLINNPQAQAAVTMLAPSLLFGCIMACLRGYWQGNQDMVPTAKSQVVEAAAKLFFGLLFAYWAAQSGIKEYLASGTVFGVPCDSMEQARLAVLPRSAAGAVLGVTCSTICGVIYLLWYHKRQNKKIPSFEQRFLIPASKRKLLFQLFQIAAPVCLASVISNLTSFIDLISVMNRLSAAITQDGATILSMYPNAIPGGIGMEQLASYLYGCYSGLAVPVYNLIPSITTVVGISMLPALSSAKAVGNMKHVSATLESSLRISALFAFPAGFGVCALADPILRLLYFSKPMEVTVIAPALRLMGISAIFVSLVLPVNAALQAMGRADLPVKLLLAGGAFKLGCNYLLVGVPQLNIQAAPVGTLACYLFVLSAGLCALLDISQAKLQVISVLGKPMLAGAGCALSAQQGYFIFNKMLSPGISTLLGIAIGGLVFLILVFSLRILKKEDIFMVPNGEKFANLLEKHHLLG
ncbi:polysaccharide biosynthesis protein [bacterium 1XD42-1]|nr:polysaccharide biosynthesis protein [bacterium 1XD42-8]RKJ65442.1 polysaccharide biosynthesis protein [bacterium 1XD42-1]